MPNSPTLTKIHTLKNHIIMMSESNGNIIKHQVNTYDKWLEQQGLHLKQDVDFDFQKEDSISRDWMNHKK